MRAELRRDAYTRFGILGEFRVFDDMDLQVFSSLSAEKPDRGHTPNISCIPEAEYRLVRSIFHRGGYPCFQILAEDGSEIPGRRFVKIHIGNVADDVQGCVVLGFFPITHKGQWGAGPSGGPNGAFTRFMEVMDELSVSSCPLSIYYRKG